jgi:hypothetical protein
MTPRIFALSFGLTVSPLTVNGVSEDRSLFLVKCTMAVFSPSNWAPLRLSQSKARSMMAWMPARFASAVGPTTQAVQSSTKAMEPPFALILCCTRSALKKRKSIGDSGDPCGKPA